MAATLNLYTNPKNELDIEIPTGGVGNVNESINNTSPNPSSISTDTQNYGMTTLKPIELKVLEKIIELDSKMIIYNCGYLASKIFFNKDDPYASNTEVNTVKKTIRNLRDKGLIEIYKTPDALNKSGRACKSTVDGKQAAKTGVYRTTGEFSKTTSDINVDIPKIPQTNENEINFKKILANVYAEFSEMLLYFYCAIIFRNCVYAEFSKMLSSKILDVEKETENKIPLIYSEQGKFEGFNGSVYALINETVYRVGLVTAKNELIPSPEVVYAQIASIENKKNWGARRFNQEVMEIYNNQLGIGVLESKSLVFRLEEKYRDIIATANRNLTDSGKLFLDTSKQLFTNRHQKLSLTDSKLKPVVFFNNYEIYITKNKVYLDIWSLIKDNFSAQEKKVNPKREEKNNGQKERKKFKKNKKNRFKY